MRHNDELEHEYFKTNNPRERYHSTLRDRYTNKTRVKLKNFLVTCIKIIRDSSIELTTDFPVLLIISDQIWKVVLEIKNSNIHKIDDNNDEIYGFF